MGSYTPDKEAVDAVGEYKFEILPSEQRDHPLEGHGPWYVSIRDEAGTPLFNTFMSRRFSDTEQAEQYCKDLAAGKYSIQAELELAEKASSDHLYHQKNLAKEACHNYLADLQKQGFDLEKLPLFLSAYDNLMASTQGLAHTFLRDGSVLTEYLTAHPQDKSKDTITLGTWLERYQNDVDVCLVDNLLQLRLNCVEI